MESAACLAWVFAYISSSVPARCQEKYVHFVEMALSSSLLRPSSGLCDPPHRSVPKRLGSAPGRKKNCTEVNEPAFQGGVLGLGKSAHSAALLATPSIWTSVQAAASLNPASQSPQPCLLPPLPPLFPFSSMPHPPLSLLHCTFRKPQLCKEQTAFDLSVLL